MGKINGSLTKYRNIIAYAIFGILTTIVNIFFYWLCAHILKINIMTSTIVSWILAIIFAYVTNRKWVFESNTNSLSNVFMEFLRFILCRTATGVVDWLCMFLFVQVLCFNDIIIKTLANILVIILNYILSKYMVFNR